MLYAVFIYWAQVIITTFGIALYVYWTGGLSHT